MTKRIAARELPSIQVLLLNRTALQSPANAQRMYCEELRDEWSGMGADGEGREAA